MADIHDRWLYAEEQKDMLTNYLISDIIRMSLLTNPSLDSQVETMRMLGKSAKELIDIHASLTHGLEEMLQQDNPNKVER